MALLIDTQVMIWMEGSESKIPETAKSKIFQEPNIFISKVSVWEMAIKLKTGKLSLNFSLQIFIKDFLDGYHCKMLDIELKHIYHTLQLPFFHRDPFDRILISQFGKKDKLSTLLSVGICSHFIPTSLHHIFALSHLHPITLSPHQSSILTPQS